MKSDSLNLVLLFTLDVNLVLNRISGGKTATFDSLHKKGGGGAVTINS